MAAATGFGLFLGIIAAFWYLPVYIETKLIPAWAADAGVAPGQIRIRRVGLFGADAGPIRLGSQEAPLVIDAVQIDYSPASLLRRRIQAAVISGLTLELTVNDRGDGITGWPAGSRSADDPAAVTLRDLLPLQIGRIGLRNATVAIRWRQQTLRAAVDADVDTGDLHLGRLSGTIRLSARGNRCIITAAADDRGNRIDLNLTANDLQIDDFDDMRALFYNAGMSGRMDLTTQARGTLRPMGLSSLTVAAALRQFRLEAGGTQLENTNGQDGREHPILLRLISPDGSGWQWSAAPFRCRRPVDMTFGQLAGRFDRETDGWRATAEASSHLRPQADELPGRQPLRIDGELDLKWSMAAAPDPQGDILFEVHAQTATPDTERQVRLTGAGAVLAGRAPHLSITGRLGGRLQAGFKAGMDEIDIRHAQGRLKSRALRVTGDLQSDDSERVDMALNLPDTRVDLGDTVVRLPDTRATLRLEHGDTKQWGLSGLLHVDGATLHDASYDVGLDHLTIRLPLQWPVAEEAPSGAIKAAILWKSHDIGDLAGTLTPLRDGLSIEMEHVSKLFPGLIVHIQSVLGKAENMVVLGIPPYTPPEAIALAPFLPAADGITASGRIEAEARFAQRGAAVASSARIKLENGVVRHLRAELAAEGIACEVRFEDLRTLRSAPRQRLQVERLTMGRMTTSDIAVDFQIEPGRTLFIERAVLAWCRGTVQTAAVRLTPELAQVAATLHCDRLNLAMLLEQLGAARGSGEGNVNGRIPLQWRRGRLSFDDGFLYSTPGKTGTIQLYDTQFLLEGLPPGSPQRIQLDIATEALKDYSYNWATLSLQSQMERLLVRLELDGKPNRLLPFAYHPQTGRFERVDGEGQADFKGIGFTLNFDTPLNEILHYKDFLKPKGK